MLPLDANQTTLVLDATVFCRFGNNRQARVALFAAKPAPTAFDEGPVGAGLPAKKAHWPRSLTIHSATRSRCSHKARWRPCGSGLAREESTLAAKPYALICQSTRPPAPDAWPPSPWPPGQAWHHLESPASPHRSHPWIATGISSGMQPLPAPSCPAPCCRCC